jgi:hypothetical protein
MARMASDWSGTRNLVRPFRSSRDDRSNSNPPNRATPPALGYQPWCIEISLQSAQSRTMNTSWKTISLAALGTLCVAVAADAQENPSTGDRILTVVVYDYAGLSDRSMNEVESLSAVLLSRAGIRTQWVHCLGINRVRGRRRATAIWKPDQ